MKLVSFSVENYRSITNARRIVVDNYNVLLGPNNEGKSNILRALTLGMNAIAAYRPRHSISSEGEIRVNSLPPVEISRRYYDWQKDFPFDLRTRLPNRSSFIDLNFELDSIERQQFKKVTGSAINEMLPLRLAFGLNRFSLTVAKRGPGQTELNKKASLICGFVFDRIRFEYIPAIRTAEQANEVIVRLIESELAQSENNPVLQKAVEVIATVQRPLLNGLAKSVTKTIQGFLPNVNSVKLTVANDQRFRSLRRDIQIEVDDGVSTPIDRKGDGVQSLVALAMMRYMAERQRGSASSILAIEEPESHLHPKAIRELRRVMLELSSSNQVLVSTHSPLFILPTQVSSNIIVQDKKAKPAKTIHEIRSCLGVRFSDNLQNAELMLLVEGVEDRKALGPVIADRSDIVRHALDERLLAIDTLDGGTNLSYKAGLYINAACSIHCFVDHDESGIEGIRRAEELKYVNGTDFNYAIRPGVKSSEWEDLLNEDEYWEIIYSKFAVDVRISPKKKFKWSDGVRLQFNAQGKHWDHRVEQKVKAELAEWVSKNPHKAVHPKREGPITSLISSLEKKLSKAVS